MHKTLLLYMLISGLIGAALILALRWIKWERLNKIAIRALAIVTIFIHYSPLWVDFFTIGMGTATAYDYMLFLIYPCHICMWLLLISSFLLDREDPVSRIVKDFTFWGGTFCGAIGTMFNINFNDNPTLANYDVLKGLLSHSTMVAGCILLFTAGFVKIRMGRGLSAVFAGLLLFATCGFTVNTLFAHFGIPPCNSMYLLEAPYPDMPWINVPNIAVIAMTTAFVVSALFELFALPREERWYARLARYLRSLKKTNE